MNVTPFIPEQGWNFPPGREQKREALLRAVDTVRSTLIAGFEESESTQTLPTSSVNAMYDSGLLALKLPEVLGGAEADPITQLEVIEAMALYDSAAWLMFVGATNIGAPGAYLPDEGIDEMFPNGYVPKGSGVGAPSGIASRVTGGFRVTGRWAFGSGIRHSEWVSCGIRVDSPSGGPPEIRRASIRTENVTIHDNWQVAGLKGTGSCDFSMDNMFIPEYMTYVVGDPPKRGGNLYNLSRLGFVLNEHMGFALGIGRRALNATMSLSEVKARGRNSPSLIAEQPTFQRMVGECDVKLKAARSICFEVYEEVWHAVQEGRGGGEIEDANLGACAVYATDVAVEVATLAFRAGGGSALYDSSELQVCLRDANAAAQHFVVSDATYQTHGMMQMGLNDPI